MSKRLLVQGLMAGLYILFVSIAYAGTEGSISGTVIDGQGISVPEVPVQVLTQDGKKLKETKTSVTGEYHFFDLSFGEYRVVVNAPGFESSSSTVKVASGANSEADIILVPGTASPEMLVEVKAKRRLVQASVSTSSTELNREQIGHMPQGMEVSLPKLIANTTPGVVQGPFGQTFIRGNHANIQYQIDGVQLPDSPSNTFGQAISPRNIDHMEIITGGIPAEYGQRLSAVVNIVTKSGPEDLGGEIELNYGSYNTISPHLLVGGSNKEGNLHYFLSLNYNRTDRGLDTPQPASEVLTDQLQGGIDSIHNASSGNSEFAKIDWLADNSNKLSFIVYNSQSSYQIPTFPSSFRYTDPFFQPGYTDVFGNTKGASEPTYNFVPTQTDDNQSEINTFAQFVWKHTFSERSFFQLAPYYKYSQIVVTNDPVNDLFSKGVITGATPSSFSQNRHMNNLGLKSDYTFRPNDQHLIKTGFQVQASRSDGTITVQTDLTNAPLIDSSPNIGYFEGIYLQDDFTIFKPLVLNAGLRFDATQFTFPTAHTTDSLLQPRVGLSYLLTDTTKLHVFYGKLFQAAPVENLRYQFIPNTGSFKSLDFYDIKAEKDDYYETGISQQFFDKQLASLNVYYKEGINILDDAQLLNTSIAQPYNFATGHAYGLELSLKGELTQDWSEYASYSYQIARGKGMSGGISDEATDFYQMLDHVQVHTANAGLTFAKNYFWWSTQGVYGSGLRTGPNNSISLPDHFTFDTTVGYQFHGDSWFSKFKLSGDVLNIFDNRYPITIANGFNGSHYAVGRQFFIRIAQEF